MANQYNPFKENRAEQMYDLWKYYVPIPGIESAKPLIVEGGRGSGKTMLFKCNSWREKISSLEAEGKCASALYQENNTFIGIYYRVDTTFVSAMIGKNKDVNEWTVVFNTYLSICVLSEVVDLLKKIDDSVNFDRDNLKIFIEKFSKKLSPLEVVETLGEFRNMIDNCFDEIEDMLNGFEGKRKFRPVNVHRFLNNLFESCNLLLGKEILFKIFIDEYETLQNYQQEVVNTLIKHSTLPVIFNIGMRPCGMKTAHVISIQSFDSIEDCSKNIPETIETPHDYEELFLEIGEQEYPKILKEICAKRIELGKSLGKIPVDASENIEDYLGKYSIEGELALYEKSEKRDRLKYLNELEEEIRIRGKDENLPEKFVDQCVKELCYELPLVNSKLHYLLLKGRTKYSPKLKELHTEYIDKSKRYDDWMHNRKLGIVFLLAKDFRKKKMYYGFDVFSALSSNIVRYFLELCEQTFRDAFLHDYKWKEQISTKIQSDAAYYVSQYKVTDIIGYEPYGKNLRIFTQHLGKIFNELHTSDNTTLGEPEPNHFYTKDLDIPEKLEAILYSAIMWNVLQVSPSTKKKQAFRSAETVDYHLNKVYAPYFGISYRTKRKIKLDVELLELLLEGNSEAAEGAVKKFLKSCAEAESDEDQPIEGQMVLFEPLGGLEQ